MKTMGELWDIIEPLAESTPAEFWLKQWKMLGDDTTFDRWRAFEASELQVRYLLEDLTAYFQEEMSHISTDEFYAVTLRNGRAVMTMIAEAADRFGSHFGDAARIPATPSEALMMAGLVKVRSAAEERVSRE